MGKSLAVLKQQSPQCTIWKAYQNKMHQCTMYNIIHNIAVFQYLSKTCAASCDVIEISKLPSDWVFQKVEHSLLQIQVPYWLAALYAKNALILSFPSQKCALFLVLRGLCPFSSSMMSPSSFIMSFFLLFPDASTLVDCRCWVLFELFLSPLS